MISSDDYKPSLAFGLLLQGPAKTGKTRILMGFPDPYILDTDNNLSGAARSFKLEFPDKKFYYDTVGVDENGTVIPEEKRWERGLNLINAALADKRIRTIGVDSVSTLCDNLIAHIVANKGANKKEGMTISDWQPFRYLLSKLVTDLRLSKKYIVFTSHEENAKDEVTGQVITRTNIPSKLADNFGGFFSDVWRTTIDEVAGKPIYVVQATPTPRYPSIGNSLGLEGTFRMNHDKLLELLQKAD